MGCCPNGIYAPLIIDCGGFIRPLQSNESLRAEVEGVGVTVTPGTTDNAVVRADGTSNDTIQGSTAIIDDNGVLTLYQDSSLETSGAHGTALKIRDSLGVLTFELSAQIGGTGNLGFGANTLGNITVGTKNLCFGTSAGQAIEDGDSNICIGRNSGYDLISGDNNLLVGPSAGQNIVGGSRNILFGESSGNLLISGDDNIGLGNAVLANATGSDLIGIGRNAGRSITSGGTSTFVGNEAGYHASQLITAINSTALGNQSYTTANNQIVIGNSSVTETWLRGNIGINQETPNAKLDIVIGSADAVTGLLIAANDVDEIACDIQAAQTTAHVIDIQSDSLTTGSALNIDSDSSSTSARSIANIHQNNAAATSAVGLVVRQDSTADILQCQDSSGTTVTSVSDTGDVACISVQCDQNSRFNADNGDFDFQVSGDTITHMIFVDASAATENIALISSGAPNWQSMDGGIFIGNATTIPTGNPTGGGFLYVESGALKFRGSSGTITPIAPA